ncbi:ABC transporter ATP-binding protein [Roseburia sp.]|uniref:ABC transporter ATP-binding protein n=1 Tax=Roseburia sp. TaxID=2049040 RepID=UPI003521F78A
MRKLLVYLKDYKKESVLGPLFKLLEATFELIVPLVMAAIIDTGVASGDKTYIMRMCMVLVLLAVIGLTCSITAQYFAAKAAVGFATKLRHALFAHIESLSFTEMDTVGTATLITRMTSDVNQVQNGVNLVLRLFLRSPFIVFGAMVMAFTIDIKAALVFVVTIPLLSVIVFGIMLISIPLYKKVQSALDKVLGITRENLTGSRVIRAFNKEEDEREHFNENNDLLTRAQIYVGKISALMNPLTYVIINGAIVVLVWTGAVRVDNGYITQGQVVALINYMSQILVELVKLANLIININKSIACGNRIQSVFEMQSSITDGSSRNMDKPQTTDSDESEDTEYAVEFSHVGLTYAGAGDESLTDIDFKVKKGETIGIIGGTGSGKSSVVNLIPRFYDVTAGSVKVDGKNVKDYSLEELRGKIGTVLQKAVLFHGSIRENLKWGNPDASEEDLINAVTVAQAKEFIDNKEGGLDFEVEQGGKNLSGGQRQRLTIARAVVKKPEILILDDSASALDFATDAALRKAIREMEGGTTVFIVSQRAASIQHADRIVVLDDGKIVGLGTSEELLESCEVYQEIYNSQFKKQEGGKTA